MKNRKVKFKVFIPAEYERIESKGYNTKVKGTGVFTDFIRDGLFHQWGINYEEFENGPANYSIALIEDLNGLVHEVLPENLKFINDEKQNS